MQRGERVRGISETACRVMKEGKPDFPEIDPLLQTMPGICCRTPGKYAGDAGSAGKNLMQQSQNSTRKGR